MDKKHIKGARDKASGSVKEAVGNATGNENLRAKGKAEKAKGETRQAVGDVKDAMKGKHNRH